MKMVVFSPSAPWKTQLFLLLLTLVIPGFNGGAQYTEVINSNRPGQSVSAYAVGTGVIQLESGFSYAQSGESNDNLDSNLFGLDFGLRYGLLLENLELHYEGTYLNQTISDLDTGVEENLSGFGKNRLGAKYLVFDPFKNPERNKPNLLSWRANNKFQLRNLVPAVSVYAGANFNFGDNPFFPNEPSFSPRALVATQSRLTPRSVLVTNLAYDRIGTDFPELSYLISYTHAFRNPRWSVFLENQGIDSDRYSDMLLRSGLAYLVHEDFQADVSFTYSFNDPGGIFATGGISYRLDYHKDKAIDDQKSRIKRNSMKKKKGSDIGKSRKEKRQMRKNDRKAAAALDSDN